MREVEAAEYAVPVGVVALGAADGPPSLWGVATTVRQRGQRHHHFVHAVRLGVLHQEMVPVSAPHERRRRREVFGAKLFFQPSEVLLRRWWERPRLHFPVRRRAQVGESSRGHRAERFLAGRKLYLAGGREALHRLEKTVQPPGAVDPILGSGPPPEFLPVVREDRQAVALSAE